MDDRALLGAVRAVIGDATVEDDCAVLPCGEWCLVLTTDMLHETTDFPEGMTGSLKSLPRGQRIEAAITKFCAERTVDEVEAIMNKAGIPNQKAFGPADIEKSAQYAARHDIATWTDSVYGEMKGIGITNKFKKNPAQIVASAPTFGEHSREVLEFLGYTQAQIDDMYAKGVTATMDPRETAIQWHLKDWQFFWRDDQAEKLDL